MAAAGEGSFGLDTIMSHEEQDLIEQPGEPKAAYKSFKKKFRKLKVKFDEAMRQSNEYFVNEQRGIETAKRIALENDQILEMLLDQNNSAQMPLERRIDLEMTNGITVLPVPSLIDPGELVDFAKDLPANNEALQTTIRGMITERSRFKDSAEVPQRSLASLLATVPHKDLTSPHVPEDILGAFSGKAIPPTYLTPDAIDEHIFSIDVKLGLEPRPESEAPKAGPKISLQDISFGNKDSPYNWLRKRCPNIFLQDGEGSEKSHGKPGALRGAGKRASIPAPSKPDALEIVEEDGQGYEFALGGPVQQKSKKRKLEAADEDASGGYHPKSGIKGEGETKAKKPRASKKKSPNDEATPSTGGSTRKRKPKAKPVNDLAQAFE